MVFAIPIEVKQSARQGREIIQNIFEKGIGLSKASSGIQPVYFRRKCYRWQYQEILLSCTSIGFAKYAKYC
jgi:hypothetical protein